MKINTLTIAACLLCLTSMPSCTTRSNANKQAEDAYEQGLEEGRHRGYEKGYDDAKEDNEERSHTPSRRVQIHTEMCEDCCGRGVVLYDDYTQEKCSTCNGTGEIKTYE